MKGRKLRILSYLSLATNTSHLFCSVFDAKFFCFSFLLFFALPHCTQSKAPGHLVGIDRCLFGHPCKTKEAKLSRSGTLVHSEEIVVGKLSWPFVV